MTENTPAPEQWLPVPGYEGLYEVSDLGRIKTTRRQGLLGGFRKWSIDSHGYPYLPLRRNNEARHFRVHTLVMLAFVGPCPLGMEVCHGDGDRTNPALSNLRYGTRAENMQDCLLHGNNKYAAMTHCKWGHEFTEANTRTANDGRHRHCRECQRIRSSNRRARIRAERRAA